MPERFRGAGAEALPTFAAGRFRPGARRRRLDRSRSWSSCRRLRRSTAFSSRSPRRIATRSACRPSLELYLDGLDAPIAITRSSADAIVGDHDPAEVVLMEIEPRQQKTWPDFVVTEQMWGVRAIDVVGGASRRAAGCSTGATARRTQIKRIYNRVIPDELERKRIQLPFDYGDDLDVEWAGHPAWYFRISKFSIPWLRASVGAGDAVPRRHRAACRPIASASC